MDDQFRAIFRLIHSEEKPEVLARDARSAPWDILSKIKAFAEGKIETNDREQLIERLASNTHWIGLLAEEIKSQRSANPRQVKQSIQPFGAE